jgi:hypothetical protein
MFTGAFIAVLHPATNHSHKRPEKLKFMKDRICSGYVSVRSCTPYLCPLVKWHYLNEKQAWKGQRCPLLITSKH